MLVVRASSVHTNAEVMLLPPLWANSKEEEKRQQQQQPHQILASHAARTSRARVRLHRYLRRDCRHQYQQQAWIIRTDFEPLSPEQIIHSQDRREARREQLRKHRMIPEPLAQTSQRS